MDPETNEEITCNEYAVMYAKANQLKRMYHTKNDVFAWLGDFASRFEKYGQSIYEYFKVEIKIFRSGIVIYGINEAPNRLADRIVLRFRDSTFFYKDEFDDVIISSHEPGKFMEELMNKNANICNTEDVNMIRLMEHLYAVAL